jgi:hypothetical protein
MCSKTMYNDCSNLKASKAETKLGVGSVATYKLVLDARPVKLLTVTISNGGLLRFCYVDAIADAEPQLIDPLVAPPWRHLFCHYVFLCSDPRVDSFHQPETHRTRLGIDGIAL